MTDLNSLGGLPAGVVLTGATAINNMGQIAVNGYSTPAIPEPASYVLTIAGLGLIGFAANRRKQAGKRQEKRVAVLPDNLTGKQWNGIV